MWRRIYNLAVFYIGWVVMIAVETYLWALAGIVLGTVLFIVGGVAWAVFHSKNTKVGELEHSLSALYAPTLWAGFHATRRFRHVGLILNTALNGAPGVSLVETSMGYSWAQVRNRVWIAALGYALFWCVVHYVRPPLFIPIHWYPSIDALYYFSKLFS